MHPDHYLPVLKQAWYTRCDSLKLENKMIFPAFGDERRIIKQPAICPKPMFKCFSDKVLWHILLLHNCRAYHTHLRTYTSTDYQLTWCQCTLPNRNVPLSSLSSRGQFRSILYLVFIKILHAASESRWSSRVGDKTCRCENWFLKNNGEDLIL